MKTDVAAIPQGWDEIVFEHRNKEYGAYFIRKIYSKNVMLSWIIMMVLTGLIIAGPTIAEFFKSNGPKEDLSKLKQTVVTLDQPPPIMPNQPPPPRLEIPPPVKTLKYVAPKVTTKEVVEEEVPTIEEIKKTEISTETTEGPETVVFEEPVKEVVDNGNDDQIYTVVEQQPEFPGGTEAMMKFIQRNMKYPPSARRMGTEGRVFIGFVVNNDGKIQDIQTVKGISTDCDNEAKRVVAMMPNWKPGKQNGRAVRVRFVLPVNFKLAE
jgi:periplasmic protein TonB